MLLAEYPLSLEADQNALMADDSDNRVVEPKYIETMSPAFDNDLFTL